MRVPIPLEEQLQVLATCGIRPREDMPADRLLEPAGNAPSRADIEARPWDLVLALLGGKGEVCDRLLEFPMTCIDEPESYRELLYSLARITGMGANLGRITAAGGAPEVPIRVSFDIDGATHHLELENSQFLDDRVVAEWDRVLVQRQSPARLYWLDVPSLECVLAFLEPENAARLAELTTIEVRPASAADPHNGGPEAQEHQPDAFERAIQSVGKWIGSWRKR